MKSPGAGSFPRALRWVRPPWIIQWTVFAVVGVLLLGSAGDGIAGMPTSGRQTPRHDATPAPKQRWGSAAGKSHLAGSAGNRTVPKSLRSQYPVQTFDGKPAPGRNTARVAEAPRQPARGFDPASSRETPGAKSAYERVYDNADGSQTTTFSTVPVNVKQPDGSWQPFNRMLSPLPDGGWRSAAGVAEVRLAGRADVAELARVAVDERHAVGFGLAGAAASAGRADGDTVTYPDVRPLVDLRLRAGPGRVKETLVLRSADAAHEYLFPLRLTGLTAKVENGQVVLNDKAGKRRAAIPAGYMIDSGAGEAGPGVSTGVTYQLVTDGGQPALKVSLDSAWLRDPARVYPVEMDPSVGPPVDDDGADTSMVVHGNDTVSGGSELLVGKIGGSAAASYLKFNGLVNRLRNHTIFGAQLQVVNYDAPSCRARPVSVHPVTAAWSPGSTYSYPGPAVGKELAERSFAHGYIATGQSRSNCPAAGELFDLGDGGTKLVQGWVDGQANHGLSLRASATDAGAWKKFAGSSTANPPTLYVTHSPYHASYEIPNPVPEPAVLQNQAGKVKVTVQNLSAEAWAPGNYYLAYRAYTADKGEPVGQHRAANLTAAVPRDGKVTLEATIGAMPPGTYFLDFTMVKTGGVVFTDHQVPPGRIVLQVIDIAPVAQEVYPPNGYQAPTLTPQLFARALDIDAPPGQIMQYKFEVCDNDPAGKPVNCTNSGYQAAPAWTVPSGRLAWSKAYQWRVLIKDANNEVPTPHTTVLTAVPQPDITSRLAAAPYGSQGREFDAQVGNFSTAAVDAAPTTAGPDLTLVRTYNSLDPRRDAAFGAGWTTRYDMRLLGDEDGSGNVVITYPDGQQVRFGRNPDGTYAAPQGRTASLIFDGTVWKLLDKSGTVYQFSGGGKLMKVSDSDGRSVIYTYNTTDGRLTRAQVSNSQTNTAGRSLRFGWTNGHVTSVSTDPVGGAALTWTYTYTGDLLTKVCAPDTSCTTYAYTPGSHYRSAVLDSKPESYWRLGESQGTGSGSEIAVNLGKDAGTYKNATLGVAGPIAGTTNSAVTLNGTSSYVDLPKGLLKKSRDATIELWFKSALTGSGGPLLGYQDAALGTPTTTGVPLLYVDLDGRVRGQFATGTIAPVVSTGTVNDGKWHHVVLTAMGAKQTLYLDGAKAGEVNGTVIDGSLLGFNQIGAAYASTPGSWPRWGTAAQRHFNGAIDEVAIYSHPIGPAAVKDHYLLGKNAADQLSTVTLPSGRQAAAASYDVNLDRIKQYTDRNGGTWKIGAPTVFGSDTDLRRSVQVLDPANRPSLYEYDALAGRLLRSGSPLGLEIRDEDRPRPSRSPMPSPSPTRTCSEPDPNDPGFCTVIPGDAGGPVFVRHTLDGMAIRSYSYNTQGFQDVVTNENGDQVTMGYDDRGNVTSKKTCRRAGECYTAYWTFPATAPNPFDPRNDQPLEQRDARSRGATDNEFRTTYKYTSTGRLETQTNPDGGVIQHTYTTGANAGAVGGGLAPGGLPLTTVDARDRTTRYAYYQNGDLARVTKPSGLITESTYDELGRSITKKEISDSFPAGVVTTYTYDALSRLKTATEPATTDAVTGVRHQRRTTNHYDADGNLTKVEVSDLLGGAPTRTTTIEYDEHGRQRQIVDAEGHETSYEYDRFGNRTSTVDANGNRYDYAYTARNSIAEVRLRAWNGDPKGSGDPTPGADYLVLHSYSYDYAGRTASDTDAMGRRLEYEYYGDDLLKRVVLKDFHNPDGSKRDYVVEELTYDGAGNKIKQVAGNGKLVTTFTIGKVGQVLTTVSDPDGLRRTSTFEYDRNGNVTKSTRTGRSSNVPGFESNRAEVVGYTYEDDGNVKRETVFGDTTNRVTEYGYDQRGLLVSAVDPRGTVAGADKAAFTSRFAYDERGRRIRATGPTVSAESGGGAPEQVNPSQTFGYNAFDELVAAKDALGHVSRTEFDKLGRPVVATAPAYTPPGGGNAITPTTRTSYDGLGNPVEAIDARDNVTRFSYDRLNRLITRDVPASDNDERAVWRYAYTRTGEVLSVTDPTGARVESTYDDLDRKITLTQIERRPVADTFTTKFNYDDAGNVTSVVAPSGATTSNVYDSIGALIKTTDPAQVSTQLGYDFTGRQVRTQDGLGRVSTMSFDTFGQVSSESDVAPDGAVLRTQRYGYDAAGNLLSATDPHERTTTYAYNAADQLVRQVEPVGPGASITTTFGYDAAGNRTRYTDGRGNTTVFTVNSLGLPESVVEPSTTAHPDAKDRTWTVAYDKAGQRSALTAPGGVTRQRSYDAAGRLTAETGTGGEAATTGRSMVYDLAGRLTKVSAPGGTNTYSYNDRGSLLSATGPSGTGSFGYNDDGQLSARTDAAGTAAYTYQKGRLATVTDGMTGTTQTLGYDGAGQLKTLDYGGGRVRTYDYDNFGRVAADTLRNAAGQTVASVSYGYDVGDRLTRKTTVGLAGAGEHTYGYDFAGRLTSWTSAAGTVEYGWDDSGNRTKAGAKNAVYDERNRLKSDGDYTYEYTARGSLRTRTSSGLAEQYSFDAFDRLVSSEGQNYTYDGLDRVAARNGTNLTYGDQSDSLVSDGTEKYARGPGEELLAVGKGQTKRLTVADRHGDVIAALDPADSAAAAPADSTAYDPFGQVTSRTGDTGRIGFQGDWTDPNTGQVDMGARWYDPGTASFISRDSVSYSSGPSALANRYTYAGGDPLNATDPDGHWPKFLSKIGNAIVSGVKTVATAVTTAVTTVAHYAWSGLKALGNTILDGAKWVYNKAKSAVNWVADKVSSAVSWVKEKASAAVDWAKQKAQQIREAAVAAAKRVTAVAKQAVSYAIKHNPLPALVAAVKPLYNGLKTMVSTVASLPAAVVSTVRNVVNDVAKSVQQIYNKAVEVAGAVVENVSKAVESAVNWVEANKATIAGFAAGLVVGVGCGALIGWTGVGAVACGALAGAVGSIVHDLVEGGHGWKDMLVNATVGGVIGGLTGGLGSVAGQFVKAGIKGLSGGAGNAVRQGATAARNEISNIGRGLVGKGCNSFAANTAVLMDREGTRKQISEVKKGEYVVATDPTTGRTESKRVTDVIIGEEEEKRLVEITVSGGEESGTGTSTITATDEHPFWLPSEHRWVHAKDLKSGYVLETADHRPVTVVLVTPPRTEHARVYNLSVDKIHTYYVMAGDTPVLVHNCAGGTNAAGKPCGCGAPRIFAVDSAGEATAMPVHEISRSGLYGGVAQNVDNAVSAGRSPLVNRMTGRASIRANRNAAQAGEPRPSSLGTDAAGRSLSWEEFPFASTMQGGSGASLRLIAREENVAHGRDSLWPFLRDNGVNHGDPYYVRTVD